MTIKEDIMKKTRILMLLIMVLTLCFSLTALAEESGAALPAVGDKIGGFVVQSVTPMK